MYNLLSEAFLYVGIAPILGINLALESLLGKKQVVNY